MKPIVEKILSSGLIDRHLAKLMENWGYLPEGSVDRVKDPNHIENLTREQIAQLAEEIAFEVEKEQRTKEMTFDLDKMRWPASVSVYKSIRPGNKKDLVLVAYGLQAMVDRMGRFYFRSQDVAEGLFQPGWVLVKTRSSSGNLLAEDGLTSGVEDTLKEEILEAETLYLDESPVCVVVTTGKL